jgi:Cu2+-exporting ATPase
VQGIHCAACVWLLQTLFRRLEGGLDLRINPALGKAEVVWAGDNEDLRAWIGEAEAFGYRFGPDRKETRRVSRDLIVRLGISAALAMNVMIFTFSFYFGLDAGEPALYRLFGALNFVLATLSVLIGGSVFVRGAILGLRRGLVHLDLPIALGILLAYAGSSAAYFTEGIEGAYFDTVTIFIALMLTGRWLQEHLLERNRSALLADEGADNIFVRVRREDGLRVVPAYAADRGDELWVVPGEIVPMEAILLGEPGDLALDWITGESEPRVFQPGDRIPAGAFNAGSAPLRMHAEERFEASRLHALLAGRGGCDLEAADREGQGWWRRVSAIYVSAVLALAAAGFAVWIGRGLERAVPVAVSILVVACPCALGLAIPLARELTTLGLRRRGVFVREPGFLDRALAVRKVLFDKTGTLTFGRPILTGESRRQLDHLEVNDRRVLLQLVAQSNHPVSRALATALGFGSEAAALTFDDSRGTVVETAGEGLELTVGRREYRLGRPGFARRAPAIGSETLFTVDGDVLASFRFEEELKADAPEEVRALREAGYALYLLSGDDESKVAAVRERLGLAPGSTRAGMSPEAKAEWVRELDQRDTLMVGDGLNDGPGLATAFCAATPAVEHPSVPARSDFYFLGEGIAAVRNALDAAHRLRATIRLNLLIAGLYNAIALTLCFLGWVTPVVAAVLMPVSSVLLVSLTAGRLMGRGAS